MSSQLCCQWFLKDKIEDIQSICMSEKKKITQIQGKRHAYFLIFLRRTKLTFDSNNSYPSPLEKYQMLVSVAYLHGSISSPVARKSPDWQMGNALFQ